jgi:hypothetical protein
MDPTYSEKKEDVEHVEHAEHLATIDSLEKGNTNYVVDPVLEKQTMFVPYPPSAHVGRRIALAASRSSTRSWS